jgi:hypothetical protein
MTSPSNSRHRPHRLWPQCGDLGLDLALGLGDLARDLTLDLADLAASTSPSSASRQRPRPWWPSSWPRPWWLRPRPQDSDDDDNMEESCIISTARGRTREESCITSRQELAGNLQSWLQLWFCSSLHHLAYVLQLNRSSIDAYVTYGVCSRIFAMPILGSDLGNSMSDLV